MTRNFLAAYSTLNLAKIGDTKMVQPRTPATSTYSPRQESHDMSTEWAAARHGRGARGGFRGSKRKMNEFGSRMDFHKPKRGFY